MAIYGHAGQILWVDLAKGEFAEEPTEPYAEWIGGRGLGLALIARLPELYSERPEEVPVAVSAGSLVGSAIPLATRASVTARNLISGGISYSNVGGDFGLWMKSAGYDAVVLRGSSPRPVYLLLGSNGPQLLPADGLWGLEISPFQNKLSQLYPGFEPAFIAIGPAGENQVRIACLMAGRSHAAGWGGSGALFGAKKLKAIVAIRHTSIRFAFPEALREKAELLHERMAASAAMQGMKRAGTHGMAAAGGFTGKVPTAVKNLRSEYQPPDEARLISEEALKKWEISRTGCYGCVIQCLHVYHLPSGDHRIDVIEGMHANSVRGLGPNLGVSDPQTILRLHHLANENGLDVDGLSTSLAFALECAEYGILPREQPGDVQLVWGDGQSLLKLAKQIIRREGIGGFLAEGVYRAAEQIGNGSQAYAVTTKKVGINEQGIRSHRAWAIGIMTSNRGGGHLGGSPQIENRQISPEEGQRLFGNPSAGVPAAYEGKGRIAAWTEGVKAAVDSLGLCYFAYGWYDLNIASLDDLAELYSLASGRSINGEELHRQGLRVHTLERILNHRLGGFDRRDDSVPPRFYEQPNDGGPYEGAHLDRSEIDRQLDEYYRFLEWDPATGLPGEECIRSHRLEPYLI